MFRNSCCIHLYLLSLHYACGFLLNLHCCPLLDLDCCPSPHNPPGNNLVFVSYAAWESPADLWDAAKSKAVREFIEYVADEGIAEVTKKLWKVPSPHF